jgi:DNA (cytosine-5)-methyltransferase 1
LLKEWEKLCCYFSLIDSNVPHDQYSNLFSAEEEDVDGTDCEESNDEEIFEVSEVHDIRYADANKENKPGLYFKVVYDYFVYFLHHYYICLNLINLNIFFYITH